MVISRHTVRKSSTYRCRDIEIQTKIVIFGENRFLYLHESYTKKT